MGIIRRLAGFLGFSKDESRPVADDDNDDDDVTEPHNNNHNSVPRKGFSVPVHVPVSRAPPGPVLVPSSTTPHGGGVQGLRWFAKRLRIDEDGDVADEFLNEIMQDTPSTTEENQRKFPRFELKYSTKPATVTNQALSAAGGIKHRVEYQGRLEWI